MKSFVILVSIALCSWFFYFVNWHNYVMQKAIKDEIVEHPDLLPDSKTAKATSTGFKNLVADLYWLQAIQYIGGNAVSAEYKKYLFVILDLITDLNPYFESPYIIGQLLLPDHNDRYENRSKWEQEENISQAEILGLKWVENFCDQQKIEAIFAQDDLGKLRENDSLKNPCQSYTIPYYLAYIYFFYQNDPATASQYYKVASTQEDAPEGAKILTAIMQGKWGNREKSLFMFLSLAENAPTSQPLCKEVSSQLQDIYLGLTSGQVQLNGELIAAVEKTRNEVFPVLTEENENEILDDTNCTNFLHKAIRELNLLYIAQGNQKFMNDHPQNLPARNAKALFETGYIDFLPTDYQQLPSYGIIYAWDYERGRYDYENGEY